MIASVLQSATTVRGSTLKPFGNSFRGYFSPFMLLTWQWVASSQAVLCYNSKHDQVGTGDFRLHWRFGASQLFGGVLTVWCSDSLVCRQFGVLTVWCADSLKVVLVFSWTGCQSKDNKLHIFWTVHLDTNMSGTPTRCTLLLNNVFQLNYPQHVWNKQLFIIRRSIKQLTVFYCAEIISELYELELNKVDSFSHDERKTQNSLRTSEDPHPTARRHIPQKL